MNLVTREEILDFVTYDERRASIREDIMETKDLLRVHLGEYLTFLFENHDTVWYQIQEMMRIERIVREADIQHEIDTYNELLGAPGELGCSLLIEIESPEERDIKLTEWRGLPEQLYLLLESGEKVYAQFDPRQVGESRLSSVQYLRFKVDGKTPAAIGADHEKLTLETQLTPQQRDALAKEI